MTGDFDLEKEYLECLSKLYGMIGLMVAHKL